MNAPLTVIVGASIIAFLCFYFVFKLREQERFNTANEIKAPTHEGLQLLLIVFGFLCFLFIAKGVLDMNSPCELVPINQTVVGNTTLTEYGRECYVIPNNTNITFYDFMLLFTGFVGVYLSIHIIAIALFKVRELIKNAKGGRKRG